MLSNLARYRQRSSIGNGVWVWVPLKYNPSCTAASRAPIEELTRNTLRFSSSLAGVQKVDLVKEYDRTTGKIITDHKDLIKNYLQSRNVPLVSRNTWDQSVKTWLEFASNSEDSTEIWSITVAVKSLINKNQLEVRNKRSGQVKLSAPVTAYDRFLKALYPLSADAFKRSRSFNELFKAYTELPVPAPRYIQAKHLEETVSLFMSARDRNPYHLMTVLFDIVESGLPITNREQNIAIRKFGSSLGTELSSWSHMEERFKKLVGATSTGSGNDSVLALSDVMSLNVSLAVSFAARNNDMIARVFEEFKNSSIQPDRNTFATFMIYEGLVRKDSSSVKSLYQDLSSGNYIIDMSMMNVVMMSLLSSGLESMAELCLSNLLKFQVAYPTNSVHNPHSVTLERKLELMDYLLSIIRTEAGPDSVNANKYKLPLIPDAYSYGVFIRHYCETTQESRLLSLLNVMATQGVIPDRFHFYQIYKAYATTNGSGWSLEGLNRITEFVCSIPSISHDVKCLTLGMATVALKAYRSMLPPNKSSALDELERQFQSSVFHPHHIRVSNLMGSLAKLQP